MKHGNAGELNAAHVLLQGRNVSRSTIRVHSETAARRVRLKPPEQGTSGPGGDGTCTLCGFFRGRVWFEVLRPGRPRFRAVSECTGAIACRFTRRQRRVVLGRKQQSNEAEATGNGLCQRSGHKQLRFGGSGGGREINSERLARGCCLGGSWSISIRHRLFGSSG